MELPIFYKKPVVLSRETHAGLRIESKKDFRFATGSNSVALTAVEFAQACHEYPIVFVQDKETINPVAILGLKEKQNLFIDAKGNWKANYVPAYVRRYPFILGTKEDNPSEEFTLCIDEAHSGFNQEQGEQLFLEDGEQSNFLKKVVKLVQEYQTHSQLSSDFAKRLMDWELLHPLQANVEMRTGSKMSLSGFMAVDQKKLKALPTERLAELMQQDGLGVIYYHLLSLNNFGRLVDRVAEAA